jgi:hypothetical protein
VGRNSIIGDLSNFERGQIVGVHLAGASVTKLPQYWVYQEKQFLLCWHIKIMIRTSEKRNTGQKSTLT